MRATLLFLILFLSPTSASKNSRSDEKSHQGRSSHTQPPRYGPFLGDGEEEREPARLAIDEYDDRKPTDETPNKNNTFQIRTFSQRGPPPVRGRGPGPSDRNQPRKRGDEHRRPPPPRGPGHTRLEDRPLPPTHHKPPTPEPEPNAVVKPLSPVACEWNNCVRWTNAIMMMFTNAFTHQQFNQLKYTINQMLDSCAPIRHSDRHSFVFTFWDESINQFGSTGLCEQVDNCHKYLNGMSYNQAVVANVTTKYAIEHVKSRPSEQVLFIKEHSELLKNHPATSTDGSIILLFIDIPLDDALMQRLSKELYKFHTQTDRYLKLISIDESYAEPQDNDPIFRLPNVDNITKIEAKLLPCFAKGGDDDERDNGGKANLTLKLTLGLSIGVVAGVVLSVALFCGVLRPKWKKKTQRNRRLTELREEGVRRKLSHLAKSTKERYKNFQHANKEVDQWEIDTDRVEITDTKLGSGAFSVVYKGILSGAAPVIGIQKQRIQTRSLTDCECAVKVLPDYADFHAKVDFIQEINFMKDLGYYKHLVNLIACVTIGEPICLITEFCERGDLLHLVRKEKDNIEKGGPNSFLKYRDLLSFAWQICDGMAYLSSKGCIHRDLAARNVLVDEQKTAKIGDFGLCRLLDRTLYTTRGGRLPIKWMAVESLRLMEYSTKSDVWSFGIVLFELFTLGLAPYNWLEPTQMIDYLMAGNRLERPEHADEQMYSIMKLCWLENPDDRPHFEQLRSNLGRILERSNEHYGYVETSYERMFETIAFKGKQQEDDTGQVNTELRSDDD